MKKLFILFIFLFCLMFLKAPFSLCFISQNYNATHTFYTTQSLQNENFNIVQNGNGFLIYAKSKDATQILTKLSTKNIQGESFCFDGNFGDVKNILKSLNAKVIKKECFNDFLVIYANSPKLGKYVYINLKKVNVQIVIKKEKIIIGTPIILGSY